MASRPQFDSLDSWSTLESLYLSLEDIQKVHNIKSIQDSLKLKYEKIKAKKRNSQMSMCIRRELARHVEAIKEDLEKPYLDEYHETIEVLSQQEGEIREKLEQLNKDYRECQKERAALKEDSNKLKNEEQALENEEQIHLKRLGNKLKLYKDNTNILFDPIVDKVAGTIYYKLAVKQFCYDDSTKSAVEIADDLWNLIEG